MQRIIIDMDEVMSDTMGAMINWYEKEHGLPIDYGRMLGKGWVNGFPEHHQEMIWNRILSSGFFRDLPVMKDAVDVIKEMNNRYEVFIVSAATEFPNSLKEKLEWLMEHFPFLTWKQLVLCGDKRVIQGDFMIDDHVKNLVTFKGKPYIFTTPHNLDVKEYDRIDSWEDAAKIFLL